MQKLQVTSYKLQVTFFAFCFLLSCSALFGQTKTVKNETKTVEVEGMWQVANITPEKARLLAIERAKANALEEAGIETFIDVKTLTVTGLVEHFISLSNSEIIGEITAIKYLKDEPEVINGLVFWKIEIRADVKINNVKYDAEFKARIDDVATTYNEGDELYFSITPTKDCYVHIFWFDDAGNGAILYPNKYEPMQQLKSKIENKFPQVKYGTYPFEKTTKEEIESNNLVFVFTKKEIPYLIAKDGSTTLEDLYQWIIKIPSDQRFTLQEAVMIGKKEK
ncbi:MAG: DUF4384 domain-containing protein [Lentimicrobiaceae bacterium]|nr:DUF4384 domain-containing protein [Lentimicrobiaceae bacterium]